MQLQAVLAALDEIPELTRRVDIAADIGAAVAQNLNPPYVWLTETKGSSQGNTTVQVVTQLHEVRFGILTMVQERSDLHGRAVLEIMGDLREQIIRKLLGIRPAPKYDPVEHVGDRVAGFSNGRLYWLDEFLTRHVITSR